MRWGRTGTMRVCVGIRVRVKPQGRASDKVVWASRRCVCGLVLTAVYTPVPKERVELFPRREAAWMVENSEFGEDNFVSSLAHQLQSVSHSLTYFFFWVRGPHLVILRGYF